MLKSVQIAVLFALLAVSVHCLPPLTGLAGWNPRGPDIEDSCFMTVQGAITNTSIILEQSYRPAPSQPPAALPQQCQYFNFLFESMFYQEQVNYQLNYTNSTDPNNFVINATFDANSLYAMNGTACLLLPQSELVNVSQYLCKMSYNTVPIYLAVWGSGNFTFYNTNITNAVWPLALEQQNDPTMQANWLGLNITFPSLVVFLFDTCGSNANISSLSSNVVVTTSVNLTATLPGVWLAYTVIKPISSNSSNYSVVVSQSNATLFDTWQSNNCWNLGINYQSLLPDMNYCANGCKLSFVVMNARKSIYVLESTGVWTAASSGGNGTGNGTGNGSGNGNGTGNGGNGGNGAATSALTMSINLVVIVVLSFVYINLV